MGSMSNLVIVISLFAFGIYFSMLSYSFNAPIQAMNDMISDGSVSLSTMNYFDLMLDMWRCSPFFMVIGLILWAFERSKGTNLPAQSFFQYQFMMMFGLLVSAYLVYGFGLAMDGITYSLDDTSLVNVSALWDGSSSRNLYISIFYYTLMLPGLITSLLFMFHPIMEQRENTFFEEDGGRGGNFGGGDIGNINMGQF